MKISTKGRYGLRSMADLALHYNEGPALLKDIAERQKISMKYLDHVIKPLRENGYIERRKNGYMLSRPPEDINCLEVLNNVEGSLAPVDCVDRPDYCSQRNTCLTINVWRQLKNSMEEVLKGKTLKDLVDEKPIKF
ncbi:MAG: Rrf2 family transcriptional regulator [Candidatus Aminicenantes bacterium]|nr:Rrf2 family transcriptional regulator [Candidatus Aminicenantes bacterium]